MRRSYLLSLLMFILLLPLVKIGGCSSAPNFWAGAKKDQKKILVSFPPLYCITHAVAGDDGYVLCLLTAEGPHDYDGGPTDPIKAKDADLVIYNGLKLDDGFIIKKMLDPSGTAAARLDVGDVLEKHHHDLLDEDKGHMHEDGKIHIHGVHDPHVWLGPRQAMAMTQIIADKLAEIDPAKKAGYAARAEKFIDELKKLEAHGMAALKDKKHKSIVTQHESLGYFAKAFELKVAGAIQVKPGTDPDAKSLADLVELCQKESVKVIAVEPQYSKAQAETLRNTLKRRGIEVAIVQFDPLETAPVAPGGQINPDPAYYLNKMRENIDALAKALP